MTTELKTKNQEAMIQAMEDPDICICQNCKTVYKLETLKPGEDYNDFGNRFCHYCGNLTESFPDWVTTKAQKYKNKVVLITILGGLIDQVKFFKGSMLAVSALSNFVQTMDPENEDAGIYDKDKLIANAKDFLDKNDEYMENPGVFERI